MIKFTYFHLFKKKINDILAKKGYSDNNIYYLINEGNVKINDKIVTSKNEMTPLFSKIEV